MLRSCRVALTDVSQTQASHEQLEVHVAELGVVRWLRGSDGLYLELVEQVKLIRHEEDAPFRD